MRPCTCQSRATVLRPISRPGLACMPVLRWRNMATMADRIDEETLSDYKASDYYPVKLGDVIRDEYTVKVKLGFGRHSTTWLCTDRTQAYKTLKILTAGYAQCREVRVFEHLRALSAGSNHQGRYCVRRPEDMFTIASADEERHHQCLAFEPLGPSLLEFVGRRETKVFHIAEVRWMAIYVLNALDFLHSHQVVHADLKLDNLLLTLPEPGSEALESFLKAEQNHPSIAKYAADGHPVYESREMHQSELTYPIICDLGSAAVGQPPHTGLAQGLPYRAPEVMLGAEWSEKIDIWSTGVIIWELVLGERLFGNSTDQYALDSMVRLMGPPPLEFLDRCARRQDFFDEAGRWKFGEVLHQDLEERVEVDEDLSQFFDFVRSMLKWDARDRWSAAELLKHPWLRIE
ncbi:protein kinase [Zymoseptoria brevis]|uniref:Protein kinase n=1 Tax=Zymoseptoria brevis TaxID=1047168 RepID=A0A0F4G4U8_9PEZI|nr:protein kinase [Zymoseptoria brevis]